MGAELKGRRALVTGVASGMGRAIALAFAQEGATVAAHARNLQGGEDLVAEIKQKGGEATPVAADLSDNESIKELCEQTVSLLGGIDIVVNNC